MSAQSDIQFDLGSLQKRRKATIRLVALALLPLIFFVSGTGDPGDFGHEFIQHFGMFFIFCGILGRSWSTLYIGGRKARELVTVGPYSMSRNPLYVFSFMTVAGLGAQTGSLVVAALFAFGGYLIFAPVIRGEETALETLFADDFAAYRMQVPRYGPRFSNWSDAPRLIIDPGYVRRTVLDGLYWFAPILVFEGIEWLHLSGRLHPVLRLP